VKYVLRVCHPIGCHVKYILSVCHLIGQVGVLVVPVGEGHAGGGAVTGRSPACGMPVGGAARAQGRAASTR
jgi:hypothetical protein